MKKNILYIIVFGLFAITNQIYGNKYFEENQQRTPDRVEHKTFSNISSIEIDHKYGNIIIKESTGKDVLVEIQYFDKRNKKASCDVASKNGLLILNTIQSGDGLSLNYIINLPQKIELSTILKYGAMKAGEIQAAFYANLSYSNLTVESFVNNVSPNISVRYGSVSIGEVKDLSISLAYSDLTLRKANNLELSGRYNTVYIKEVNEIFRKDKSSYNKYKVDKLKDLKFDMAYDNIRIENLMSSFNSSCSYSDVFIGVNSTQVKSIDVNGSYSDITIDLDEKISATISASINYGDLIISKAHSIKYTEESNNGSLKVRKGKIGSKTPTVNIKTSNKYSDVKIR